MATLGLAVHAFQLGNPRLLATPYDPNGRACGVDKGVKDYPYIYFTNPTSVATLYETVCVKKCPTEMSKSLDCAVNDVVKTCSGFKI